MQDGWCSVRCSFIARNLKEVKREKTRWKPVNSKGIWVRPFSTVNRLSREDFRCIDREMVETSHENSHETFMGTASSRSAYYMHVLNVVIGNWIWIRGVDTNQDVSPSTCDKKNPSRFHVLHILYTQKCCRISQDNSAEQTKRIPGIIVVCTVVYYM